MLLINAILEVGLLLARAVSRVAMDFKLYKKCGFKRDPSENCGFKRDEGYFHHISGGIISKYPHFKRDNFKIANQQPAGVCQIINLLLLLELQQP